MSISRELSVYFYCLITIDVSKIGGCTFERNLTPAASLRCVYLRTTKYRQFGVSSCHKSTEKFAVLLLIGCSFCDCTGHIKFVTVPGTLSLWLYRTSPARDCTGQVQPVTVPDTSSPWLYRTSPARDCTGQVQPVAVPDKSSPWLYRTSLARDCTGQVQPVTVPDKSSPWLYRTRPVSCPYSCLSLQIKF